MSNILALCSFEGPQFLLFSQNVAPLVYYSHLPILIVSLLLGIFILYKGPTKLPNRVLFFTIISFVVWVFLDSIFWASNRSDVIMFVWSAIILIEPLVYIGSLYLLHALIDKRDISFNKKVILGLLYLPFVIFVPTSLTLSGFDLASCLSTEGPIALYYTYIVEGIIILWILGFLIKRFIASSEVQHRKEVVFLGFGTLLFLIAFSWGNITGSFTENWQLGQYGLFGMPIFIGILVYSIVKFGTFNIKLFGSFALVLSLATLNFSLIFLRDVSAFRTVTLFTFVLTLIFGINLIRSIVKDIKNQQHIAELNKARSDFLYIASHQLRTPVSVITGNLSLLVEGDYDKSSDEERKTVYQSMFHKAKKLTNVVNGILAASHMDNFEEFKLPTDVTLSNIDIRALTKEICESLKDKADEKKIELDFSSLTSSDKPVFVKGSDNYLEQAITNLIDNAINYTQNGFVRVVLSEADNKLRLVILDSGIGIPLEDQSRLFGKFERGKNALTAYTDGSGLGLFVVKKVIEAHGGKISFKSDGEGRGTTFTIEMKTI